MHVSHTHTHIHMSVSLCLHTFVYVCVCTVNPGLNQNKFMVVVDSGVRAVGLGRRT